MTIRIPHTLSDGVGRSPEGAASLATLADRISVASARWEIEVADLFVDEASCSWVAPCRQLNGAPSVLKISFLSPESFHEIHGLAFWDPTLQCD
jgi:hypothetical protein